MPIVKRLFRFFFVAVAFVALGIICSVNTDPVTINVPFGQPIRVPQAIVLLAAFFFGIMMVTLQFAMDLIRKNLIIRRLNKKIQKLEQSPAEQPVTAPDFTPAVVDSTPDSFSRAEDKELVND